MILENANLNWFTHTGKPCFPIKQTLPNVLHLQRFTSGTKLIIALQASNNNCSFRLRQEFRGIGKVLNNPERSGAGNYSGKAFED